MELSGQTPAGGIEKPGNRHNIFIFVMQKNLDAWQCASAQNTDILPGMETIIRTEKGYARGINYSK